MRSMTLCGLLMLLALAGCGGGGDGDAATSDAMVDAARSIIDPGSHVWTTGDGIEIPYHIGGDPNAEMTLVFVHCWMCDRKFWDAQLPVAGERYRTVTMDLPGHGEAPDTREAWTVAQYGEDVAGLAQYLGLEDLILVGHSMGGSVSLKAAALLPGRVLGIVAVDTLHEADFVFGGEQVEQILTAFDADFVGTCENMVGMMVPEGNAEVLEQVRTSGCNGERAEIGMALMRDFGTIDFPTWFREAGAPIRAINAAGAQPPTNIEGNRRYADYNAVLMQGVGHYLHMTQPDAFNPLMMTWIDELAGGGVDAESEGADS